MRTKFHLLTLMKRLIWILQKV